MITSGAPIHKQDSLEELLQLALLIVRLVPQVVRDPVTLEPLNLRVGIHSGDVVGGVVGSVMPRYTFSGDTINFAARMQQLAPPRSILVSAVTAGKFACPGDLPVELSLSANPLSFPIFFRLSLTHSLFAIHNNPTFTVVQP